MSFTRYHKLSCSCGTVFAAAGRRVIESYAAADVRRMARAKGWRYESGVDTCGGCRKKAADAKPQAESYETHKTKRRNRYRLKVGIPLDTPVRIYETYTTKFGKP